MNGQELKEIIKAGGVVYGSMLSMSRNPRWATPVAGFGLDYIVIDSEHSPRDRSEIADLLAALTRIGVVPIVRIPAAQYIYATNAIDAGAQGVLAPYCETVEEARAVAGAAKWLPMKGEFVRRAVEKGEFPSEATREYLEKRNLNNICIIGIESVPAMRNLPDILKIDGVDAIFVGPNDLTISLGIPDQFDHPDYEAALRKIIKLSREHGKAVLIHHQSVALTQKWLREGARFVLFSSDARSLHNAYRDEFAAIKAVGAEIEGAPVEDVGESKEVI